VVTRAGHHLSGSLAGLARRLQPGAPRVRDRVIQGRVKLTFGVRAANHAVLAVRAVGLHGRSRAWLAAAVASIGADAALARLLDDPRYVPSWPQWILEWLDCAVWSLATGPRGDVMHLLTGAATPSIINASIDAFAGTDAVPVTNPDRPWPPVDADDALRRTVRLLAVNLVPTTIAVVIRRRRGLPGGGENLIWSLSAAGLAAFGARHRDRLHAGERERWAIRTATQVRQEHAAARAALATASSPGHDFKKTLYTLGLYGSARAMEEARAQAAHPAALLDELGGHTLFDVTRSTRIVPSEAASLWLTDAQGREVRAFLRAAENAALDGADQALRVQRPAPDEITIRYLDHTLRLRNDPPPLQARLDPSSLVLAVAAFMAADTVMTRELPAAGALPSAALLLATARRFRHRSPSGRELNAIVACCAVSTALGFAASASDRANLETPLNRRAMPATSFAKGFLAVLGAHWGRLGPERWVLVPAIVAGWLASSMRREPRSIAELVAGGIDLAQGLAATWRLSDLVDAEAHHLETVLQREFAVTCATARAEAAHAELERYQHQLEIAREAIAELGDRLDPMLRAELDADCEQVDRWLERQRDLASVHAGRVDGEFNLARHRLTT
jgi:hypothetical protein